MKIIEEKKTFHSNLDKSESIMYGIGDVGFIFDILRNKLYENKLKAGVQEYLSNGRDSQREAGGIKPIEIWFPTSSNLFFAVRDYGTGLTHERVKEVFCMYGTSTKRNSNNLTGGLGVGSKSGFAYTDTFTIESFVDGIKKTYLSHLGDDKRGQIDLMSTENTSELNGVKISYGVKRGDVSEFAEAIIRTIMFWKPEEYPVFHNAESWQNRIKESREVGLVRFEDTNLSGVCRGYIEKGKDLVIIDGIPYPAPSMMQSEFASLKSLCNSENNCIYIHIPNGLLQVAASREKIDDSELSRRAFKQIIEAAKADFQKAHKKWDDQIVDSKSLLAASSNNKNAGFVMQTTKEFDHISFKHGQYQFATTRVFTDSDGVQYDETLWRLMGLDSTKNRNESTNFRINGDSKYYMIRNGAVKISNIRDEVNAKTGRINLAVIEALRKEKVAVLEADGSPKLDQYRRPIFETKETRNEDTVAYCVEILEKLGFKNVLELCPKKPRQPRQKSTAPKKVGNILLVDPGRDQTTNLSLEEVDKLEKKGNWVYYVGPKKDYEYEKFIKQTYKLKSYGEIDKVWRVLEKHQKAIESDDRFVEQSKFFKEWKPSTKLTQCVVLREVCKNEEINIMKNLVENFVDKTHMIYKASNCVKSREEFSVDWETQNLITRLPNYQVIKAKINKLSEFNMKYFPLLKYQVSKTPHNQEYVKWALDKATKDGVDFAGMDII